MPSWRRAPLTIALLLTACGFDRPVTPLERLPVIQGILVAGADSQFFRIDWASSADSGIDGRPRPIDPSEVALQVSGPAGSEALVPFPGDSALFVLTLPILTDSTYTLDGTVGGYAVTATTQVPSAIALLAPTGDTIHVVVATACSISCRVPYRLAAPGAAFLTYAALDSLGRIQFGQPLLADSGALALYYPAPIARLTFSSYGPEVSAYERGDVPRGNVSGAFGLFGGAVRISRPVSFE
jgi:hypothetical protein